MTTTTTTLPPNWLSYVPGRIQVFLNGRLLRNDEYVATDGLTVTLVVPASQYDVITIACLDIIPVPNPSDFYYVFLGRTIAWEDDNNAPTPEDVRVSDAETKRNIMAVKRIQPSDTSLMVPRVNWTSGTVYPTYKDDTIIAETSFYAMNTGYRIYKCIYSPGTPSTIEPTHTTAGPKVLADNYIWELLYEVPVSDRLKFLTPEYIPVKFYSTSSTFDHTGLLDYIILHDGGTGYATPPTVYILGDGYGATATATVSGGVITAINVTDGGSGYSFARVSIVGGNSDADAEAVLRASDLPMTVNQDVASYAITTAGAINTIEILESGEGYVNDGEVYVAIVGDGTGASVFPPVISPTGGIAEIRIDQGGRGYTFANVIISSITSPTTEATAKVVIEPQGGHGSNIPQELYSTVVGVSVNLEDIMSDFFTSNNFRQIGVIMNINTYADQHALFSDYTGNACYIATVSNIGQYTVDDILTTEEGGEFVVVFIDGSTMFLLPTIDMISESSTITNVTSGYPGPLYLDTLVSPEVSVELGNIIYVRNVSPIDRELGQTEQLKLFFRF
jgi:hypothetical protein